MSHFVTVLFGGLFFVMAGDVSNFGLSVAGYIAAGWFALVAIVNAIQEVKGRG